MEFIAPVSIKTKITEIIHSACRGEELYLASHHIQIGNGELMHFLRCIEDGIRIYLITGKPFETAALNKLAKLYNISGHQYDKFRGNIFANAKSVLVTSCEFERLHLFRTIDSAIYFESRDSIKVFNTVQEYLKQLISSSKLILPMLPFKPKDQIDVEDILA